MPVIIHLSEKIKTIISNPGHYCVKSAFKDTCIYFAFVKSLLRKILHCIFAVQQLMNIGCVNSQFPQVGLFTTRVRSY